MGLHGASPWMALEKTLEHFEDSKDFEEFESPSRHATHPSSRKGAADRRCLRRHTAAPTFADGSDRCGCTVEVRPLCRTAGGGEDLNIFWYFLELLVTGESLGT